MRVTLTETMRWVFGGLMSTITLLCAFAFNTVKTDVDDLKKTVPQNATAISVLQTHHLNEEKKLDKIQDDLDWLVRREIEHRDGHIGPPSPRGWKQ